jgi:hypothetical protein
METARSITSSSPRATAFVAEVRSKLDRVTRLWDAKTKRARDSEGEETSKVARSGGSRSRASGKAGAFQQREPPAR